MSAFPIFLNHGLFIYHHSPPLRTAKTADRPNAPGSWTSRVKINGWGLGIKDGLTGPARMHLDPPTVKEGDRGERAVGLGDIVFRTCLLCLSQRAHWVTSPGGIVSVARSVFESHM